MHDIEARACVVFKTNKRSHYELQLYCCDSLYRVEKHFDARALFDSLSMFVKSEYAELANACYNDDSLEAYI